MTAAGEREISRSEVEAVLATRAELGPSYEPALVDGFADKVEAAIQSRVDARTAVLGQSSSAGGQHQKQQFVLGIISLGAGIPITIPLALTDNGLSLVVAWAGMAAVNVAHALQGRHLRR